MEKPIKHLYFEVLNYLAQEGLGVDTNIKNLCGQYVNKSSNEETAKESFEDTAKESFEDTFDAFSKSWNRVMVILSSLQKEGFISYSKEYGDLNQLYIVDGNFSASITKEGLDYHYTHELRTGTIKSFKNQKLYNVFSIGIAIIAFAASVYTICQNSDLLLQVRQLEQVNNQKSVKTHLQVATHKIADTTKKNNR